MRDAWPDADLGWAVEPAAAPLLERIPDGPTVHVIDTQAWRRSFWRAQTRRSMRESLAALRAPRYKWAFDFQGLIKSAWVSRTSRASVRGLASPDLRESLAARFYDAQAPPSDPHAHIIDRGLGLVASAGAGDGARRFPRLFNAQDEAVVAAGLEPLAGDRFIVVHAAANWQSKQWSTAKWAATGRDLFRRTGMPVLWVWGPAEKRAARHTAALAGEGNTAAFATTLPQLAALLHRARLFVGGDSAPLHLAVAANTPTVGIFGPTSPQSLGPIDADDRTVVSTQPCSHCHQRRCPLGTRACLETLAPESVVSAALERLSRAFAEAG